MVEKSDETLSDPMLCLSNDMLWKIRVLPCAMRPVCGDYNYNNNVDIHSFKPTAYWHRVSAAERAGSL